MARILPAISFTTATGPTSEFKTIAGAVTDDYWDVDVTAGSGTWTFVVAFGIQST